jgi:hypothetical protein
MAVEISQTRKTPNLCNRRQCKPLPNGINLAVVQLNNLWGNNITKKRDTLCVEDSFFNVSKQMGSPQHVKNNTQMF